jgi:hypothetical protein
VFDPGVAGSVVGLTGHVFVCVKTLGAATMEVIVSGKLPLFVSVTTVALLVVVTIWPPKATLA